VPQQTLYVNFTTQVFMSIGLGLGAATPGLMSRPPRDPTAPVMPLRLAVRLAVLGAVMAAGTLGVIQYALSQYADEALARTMGIATFSIFNLLYGLTANDELESVFSRSLLANGKLLQMTGLSAVAIVLASELDVLNRFLNTTNLSVEQWVICLAVGSAIVWVSEVVKFFQRRSAAAPARVETPRMRPAVQQHAR
jgi:Ca2+-transporting ATPase